MGEVHVCTAYGSSYDVLEVGSLRCSGGAASKFGKEGVLPPTQNFSCVGGASLGVWLAVGLASSPSVSAVSVLSVCPPPAQREKKMRQYLHLLSQSVSTNGSTSHNKGVRLLPHQAPVQDTPSFSQVHLHCFSSQSHLNSMYHAPPSPHSVLQVPSPSLSHHQRTRARLAALSRVTKVLPEYCQAAYSTYLLSHGQPSLLPGRIQPTRTCPPICPPHPPSPPLPASRL